MVSEKSVEKNHLEQLQKELLKGTIVVDKTNFPEDGVCLNSEVVVQDKSTG
jgi:hypothetical protein